MDSLSLRMGAAAVSSGSYAVTSLSKFCRSGRRAPRASTLTPSLIVHPTFLIWQFEMRPMPSPHLGHAHISRAPPLVADDFLRPWTYVAIEELEFSAEEQAM